MKKVVDFLSSFGLTVAILAGMFLITLIGTLVQETEMSLYDAQRKYFDSWFVIQHVFGPIYAPLPGGVALMTALAVNLLFGGIIRLRRSWSRAGILIAHLGIAMLLLAGLVKFAVSTEGQVALYEGQKSSEFRDSYDYEIVVFEPLADGKVREYLIPHDQFATLGSRDKLTVRSAGWPFELEVFGWMQNCRIRPPGNTATALPVIDGHTLREVPPVLKHDERNLPGCFVTARIGDDEQTGILWLVEQPPVMTTDPWTVVVEDKQWGVKLRQKVHPLPFTVRLDDFRAEFHPGSQIARAYESFITALPDNTEHHIYMNAPLRRDGHVMFQSSWGPKGGRESDRLYSVFSVVTNPADKWPEWSCWVIALGLVIHFGRMLIRYAVREERSRAEAA